MEGLVDLHQVMEHRIACTRGGHAYVAEDCSSPSVFVCIYGQHGFLAAERRRRSNWFISRDPNTLPRRGFARAILVNEESYDIVHPSNTADVNPNSNEASPYFCLPGGTANAGETIWGCARRHVIDQMGLDIQRWRDNDLVHAKYSGNLYGRLFYGVYVKLDFDNLSTEDKRDKIGTIKSWGNDSIINRKFTDDNFYFRRQLPDLLSVWRSHRRNIDEFCPPEINCDELQGAGGLRFEDVPSVFTSYGQKQYAAIVNDLCVALN
jgi:hypothetical protein